MKGIEQMQKYVSFFRLRFLYGLQYRAAALAGIVTQFAWGALEILMFTAFYEADPSAFPMKFQELSSYIWMQQAFLALYMTWLLENEIFQAIQKGDIAYELCRPVNLYTMWFVRSTANRLSKAILRCFPILFIGILLPKPYGFTLPKDIATFFLFLITLLLALLVVVAFCMLIYVSAFYTVSAAGIRLLAVALVEFFSGAVIPLPFFPDSIRWIFELLPFGSMQNVPLRVYSGNLQGASLLRAIVLQVFWCIVLTYSGKVLMNKALKRVVVQGG